MTSLLKVIASGTLPSSTQVPDKKPLVQNEPISALGSALLQQPPAQPQAIVERRVEPSSITPDKDMLTIIYEIFGMMPKLPEKMVGLVKGYIPDEELQLIPKSLQMTDEVLVNFYVDPRYRKIAREIAKRIYETRLRPIKGSNSGVAFPMEPEALAYALDCAKNEKVLEIGAASGENSILMALAGANKVYVNELEPSEMNVFTTLTKELPQDIKDKLIADQGDCLTILKRHPEIANTFGLILCRNVIHFFSKEQLEAFFTLLNLLLKPGGRAIFSTNSIYDFGRDSAEFLKLCEKNPNNTAFKSVVCLITNYELGNGPIARIFHQVSICEESMMSSNFQALYLYEKKRGDKIWSPNKGEFDQLSADLKPKIIQAITDYKKEYKNKFESIPRGSVRVLTNFHRFYNKSNLETLFKSHGFEVEFTFATQKNGHFVQDSDLYSKGYQLGIIVKKPSPE